MMSCGNIWQELCPRSCPSAAFDILPGSRKAYRLGAVVTFLSERDLSKRMFMDSPEIRYFMASRLLDDKISGCQVLNNSYTPNYERNNRIIMSVRLLALTNSEAFSVMLLEITY